MRLIMRRPHAYDFMRRYPELTEVMRREDGAGIDTTRAPIPGLCLIEPDGRLMGWLDLSGAVSREGLLALLRPD